MQVPTETDVVAVLDREIAEALPGGRGVAAWRAFLEAYATVMRQLDLDLVEGTGTAVADFDVLGQLALAGGQLRMTELAERALISRSGMTRRVARLVEEGLVCRANVDTDGRGVVVALTDPGVDRLRKTAAVHLKGVAELFVAKLDDDELAIIERAMNRVIVDCTFG